MNLVRSLGNLQSGSSNQNLSITFEYNRREARDALIENLKYISENLGYVFTMNNYQLVTELFKDIDRNEVKVHKIQDNNFSIEFIGDLPYRINDITNNSFVTLLYEVEDTNGLLDPSYLSMFSLIKAELDIEKAQEIYMYSLLFEYKDIRSTISIGKKVFCENGKVFMVHYTVGKCNVIVEFGKCISIDGVVIEMKNNYYTIYQSYNRNDFFDLETNKNIKSKLTLNWWKNKLMTSPSMIPSLFVKDKQ